MTYLLEAIACAETTTGLVRCQAEGHLIPVVQGLLTGDCWSHQALCTLHLAYAPQGIHHLCRNEIVKMCCKKGMLCDLMEA